jgi:general secretion pathway protein B
MSYILDALQRAEAERARGAVPTLSARPLAGSPPPSRLGTRQRLVLTFAIVFFVVLGVAAAGWWVWRSAPTRDVVTVVSAPAAPAVQATLPAPPRAKPISPPPVVLPNPTPAREVVAVTAPPVPPKTKASVVVKAAEPSPAVPTPAQAPLLSELPEATRRQIPSMAITGAVYSENPAQRLLLVNGQVLSQGSQVAPDLTVVEIHANNSEFNFRGTRFRMAH